MVIDVSVKIFAKEKLDFLNTANTVQNHQPL
jgi:hypothetical protein